MSDSELMLYIIKALKSELDYVRKNTVETCLAAVGADLIIDELRNRKGFRHWWDNCDFQDDVIDCLNSRIEKAIKGVSEDTK